ncbi:serine--tRNA ligase, mitochondrial [Onthophagus taurus]|uniref:serine--tRNA ligase, mitochondrial n=1 Tax=Onthophagus taurus TaxID=166361 RepID=UPI0039BE25C0
MSKGFSLLKRCLHLSPKKCWRVSANPDLDFAYLLNKDHTAEIKQNIVRRKGVGDIELVTALKMELDKTDPRAANYSALKARFYAESLRIPNETHPKVIQYGEESKIIRKTGEKRKVAKPLDFQEIAKKLNLVRTEKLGSVTGSRSYFLQGEAAELENALIKYTLDTLKKMNFKIVTVPDVLHRDVIEACGLNTRGERTQVYSLDERHGLNYCLSGTSEMALAGYFMNTLIPEKEIPQRVATVSRCFRAETSALAEEKGIYRVHEFTKVEMFIVCQPEKSNLILEEIRDFEEQHFKSLGLYFQTVDMAAHELGAPAYRKYDIEAWMPGRNMYGEVSSCSNCTDYQSRRLNIKYKNLKGDELFAHTLNGTACAIPRMIIALVETYQNSNGTVSIPKVLQTYMNDKEVFGKQKRIPELQLIKSKK